MFARVIKYAKRVLKVFKRIDQKILQRNISQEPVAGRFSREA